MFFSLVIAAYLRAPTVHLNCKTRIEKLIMLGLDIDDNSWVHVQYKVYGIKPSELGLNLIEGFKER